MQQPWIIALYFCLEGVSEAEIGLDKVVRSPIDEVVTSFAEDPDVGSKAIFKSTAKVAEHPIRSEGLERSLSLPPRLRLVEAPFLGATEFLRIGAVHG